MAYPHLVRANDDQRRQAPDPPTPAGVEAAIVAIWAAILMLVNIGIWCAASIGYDPDLDRD